MFRLMSLLARVLRYIARLLDQTARWSTHKGLESEHDAQIKKATTAHDMVSHPDEPYYAKQYLHWILPECEKRFPERDPMVLDIGCGQGRFALPMAKWAQHGKVIGVDYTPAAIRKANVYAFEQDIKNVEFHEDDALTFVQGLPGISFDVVLMNEIAIFMPTYREVIKEVYRVLRPGGLLFASFRSQYFNLLYSIRERDWESSRLVISSREGNWGGGTRWFSWHTPADVSQLLNTQGFTNINLRGIGVCSGIEGDPLAVFARPSQFSASEQEHLMEIECAVAEQYAACGRYILAIAERT